MRPSIVYIDLCRSGGWAPNMEYVKPTEDEWRHLHGTEPPENWRDPRWTAIVERYTSRYYRELRARCVRAGRPVELVMAIVGMP
jgi:hypothetical protein